MTEQRDAKRIPVILRANVEPLQREQVSKAMLGRKAARKARKASRRANRRP